MNASELTTMLERGGGLSPAAVDAFTVHAGRDFLNDPEIAGDSERGLIVLNAKRAWFEGYDDGYAAASMGAVDEYAPCTEGSIENGLTPEQAEQYEAGYRRGVAAAIRDGEG